MSKYDEIPLHYRLRQSATKVLGKIPGLARGTRVAAEEVVPRRFARSESQGDTQHVDLLELFASEAATEENEDQDWDDYTQVEAALFLPPAW